MIKDMFYCERRTIMMEKKFWDSHHLSEDERAGYIILDSIRFD